MFKRLDGENEEQFIWRIGQAKDSGVLDLDWTEIADIINKEFRTDESEYRTEAAYRKPYQQAKRFYEQEVFAKYDDDTYITELQEAKHEIRKEKQKLFDERTALNKTLRETARTEEDLAKLEVLIKENGYYGLPKVSENNVISDNDMIAVVSDSHIGTNTNNYFGMYNSDIAEQRLSQYCNELLRIKNIHNSENIYVFLLGDLINGEIHFTTQLENRENVTEQVQRTAEMLSAFIFELSKHFKNVYINGVAGNHSRTSFKDQVLRGNRLDNLIPWYMKAKLANLENVKFVDENNYDATIGTCKVRGHEYLLVHGDFDGFNEKGVSKLVMMLGFKPTGIFYGHLHRCSYDDISGVKIIRSGCLSGTTDDYTISKRFNGTPSQMVCVADTKGIRTFYPIELD